MRVRPLHAGGVDENVPRIVSLRSCWIYPRGNPAAVGPGSGPSVEPRTIREGDTHQNCRILTVLLRASGLTEPSGCGW